MENINSPSMVQSDTSPIEKELKDIQELASQGNYREFWDLSLRIDELFMTLGSLPEKEFERLWSRYSKICKVVEQEEAARRVVAQGNVAKFEREIDSLRYNYAVPNVESPISKYRYGAFWARARTIHEMFDSMPLLEEDHETLWARYSSICEAVKAIHKEAQEESGKHRQLIESIIRGAQSSADASTGREDLMDVRDVMRQALSILKETQMLKEDGDYCWNHWRNVNERIGLKHQGIQTAAFEETKREAEKHTGNALQSNPYEILQGIKEVQKNLANLYLSREQRDELRHTLNDAWDRAQARIGEIREVRQEQHEEWVRRQGERKERHEEWRQRMTVNMERWDGDVKTAEEEISQLTQGIQGLQEEVAQATKAEYTRVLERMIAGKQGEITKIRDRIADLHRRIDDVKGNLERVTEAEPTTASLEG